MIGLMQAEWLKISRQGTSRVLALMVLGIVAMGVLLNLTNTIGTGPLVARQYNYSDLGFPNGFLSALAIINDVGVLICVVLVASVIGSEYGLDTWKNMLTRQNGRIRFLAAKLMIAIIALLGTFVVAMTIGQGLALIGHAMVADSAAKAGLTSINLTASQFFQNLYATSLPYLLYFAVFGSLAMAFTIIGRSTVVGIMVALVFWIGDNFSLRLLPEAWTNFTVTKNVRTLGQNLAQAGSGSIETWQSLLVMGSYIIIPLAVAFVVFRQRDMAG